MPRAQAVAYQRDINRDVNFQARKIMGLIKEKTRSEDDFSLLVELAVSHLTRMMIRDLYPGSIEAQARYIMQTSNNPSLVKRIGWALERFEKERRSRQTPKLKSAIH